MAIDYGTKRCGIAVTDPLRLIVNGLGTVPSGDLIEFLERYFEEEAVEVIVVGEPLHPDGEPAQIHHQVVGLVRKLKKLFPDKEVVMHDERFTSADARQVVMESGVRQKKRRDKSLIDKVSATLILKDYMESHHWGRDEPGADGEAEEKQRKG